MAGTAYVLDVRDNVASPGLELLRRLIQPSSRSMPHVTVLYVRGELQDHGTRIYDDFVAERLTLTRPGSFDPPSTRVHGLSTLFIQCESPQMEFLHHKPDFPDSFLHISLYDGLPSQRAEDALVVLKDFPWDLEITLPEGRLIPKSRQRRSGTGPGHLTEAAASLLKELTAGEVGPDGLTALGSRDWRALVADVATYLHETLPAAPPRGRTAGIEHAVKAGRSLYQQEELWPATQFIDPARAGLSRAANAEAHRRGGVFLTPPELAFDITRAALEYVDRSRPIEFGDPSIGSGIFLASLVNLVGAGGIGSATGVEADALRGHLTHDRWRSLGLDVVTGDFVGGMCGAVDPIDEPAAPSDDRWRLDLRSLVLANPPYIRSQRLDFEKVSAWRRSLTRQRRIKIGVRSDLYIYFVLAAHEWLQDGGVAAWLLPTEFMFTNYGAALREYLVRDVTLLAVHSYDGPSKFSNARVTSCAVIFRKSNPPKEHSVEFSAGGIIADPYVRTSVGLTDLEKSPKWHFIADEGVPRAQSGGRRIGDLFKVKRGLATGSNRNFLLEAEQASSMMAPREWLLPVVPRSRLLPDAVIEADATEDPLLSGVKWLIDVDANFEEIDSKAPRLGTYLRSIENDVMSGTIVKRRRLFYKQEQSSPARFVFSYMARDEAFGRRFFLNRSRAVILNNYLGLYPTPLVSKWLNESPENEEMMLSVLREVEPSDLARAGRVYVEGLTKVEPRELANVLLPPLPEALERALLM